MEQFRLKCFSSKYLFSSSKDNLGYVKRKNFLSFRYFGFDEVSRCVILSLGKLGFELLASLYVCRWFFLCQIGDTAVMFN